MSRENSDVHVPRCMRGERELNRPPGLPLARHSFRVRQRRTGGYVKGRAMMERSNWREALDARCPHCSMINRAALTDLPREQDGTHVCACCGKRWRDEPCSNDSHAEPHAVTVGFACRIIVCADPAGAHTADH
jgi:hypothetical protein